MSKKRKLPITNARLHSYAKNRLGLAAIRGQSIYDLATKALLSDGLEKPAGMGVRSWVHRNADFINGVDAKVVPRPALHPALRDDFLMSFAWRRLRLVVLLKFGRRCQCCGATPETGAVMNVDHVKPRKTHPELALDEDNLQVLCADCNHGKGNWCQADFRTEKIA